MIDSPRIRAFKYKYTTSDTKFLRLEFVPPQITHVLYHIRKQDIHLPAGLLEFPILVEGLPLWTGIASLGTLLAHELGHAVVWAARIYATEVTPAEEFNASFYHTTYMVRHTNLFRNGSLKLL